MTLKYSLILLTALAAGCGGGNDGGGNGGPPTGPGGGGNPPVATTTITITSAGVNPQRITVPPGSRVTFINNDSVPHEMNSDPHPSHGDCPAIEDVGFLSPNQSKQTGNLTVSRTCGYHDHIRASVTSLQGQIIVQ
jgi:plastocyanin